MEHASKCTTAQTSTEIKYELIVDYSCSTRDHRKNTELFWDYFSTEQTYMHTGYESTHDDPTHTLKQHRELEIHTYVVSCATQWDFWL